MNTPDRPILTVIEAAAREAAASCDPAHDALHLERVVKNVGMILEADPPLRQKIDELALLAASWLHDSVQLPKGDGPPGEAARQSAARARELLGNAGVEPERIEHVCAIIEEHSFSGGREPTSLESAILQDADRLDALGAIGIARFFAVAAAHGSELYNPSDPLAKRRPFDDRQFALDHIETKLLKLPEMMNTDVARRIARRRAAFLKQFRDELLAEIEPTPLDQLISRADTSSQLINPGVPTPTVPDAAKALGVSEDQVLKTLLFVNKAGEAVLAIACGTARVSRRLLAEASGLQGLRLASPDVVRERCGYDVGAVPPVGHLSRLPVIIDEQVMRLDEVYGGGGRIDALLRIHPAEIVRLTGAKTAAIVEP